MPAARDEVPCQWPGSTVVVLASGPSLGDEQIAAVRAAHEKGRCKAIAVNRTWERAPWADALYAVDSAFWREYRPDFQGQRWTMTGAAAAYDARRVSGLNGGPDSLNTGPIPWGSNSGLQAMTLAVWFGAAKLILLGLDCQPTGGVLHWHDDHPTGEGRTHNPTDESFVTWRKGFAAAAARLDEIGVACINASAETALTCFERMEIAEALNV